jgi:hypothetical protein
MSAKTSMAAERRAAGVIDDQINDDKTGGAEGTRAISQLAAARLPLHSEDSSLYA